MFEFFLNIFYDGNFYRLGISLVSLGPKAQLVSLGPKAQLVSLGPKAQIWFKKGTKSQAHHKVNSSFVNNIHLWGLGFRVCLKNNNNNNKC